MTDAPDISHWSQVAAQWIAWARAPGHDAFWAYREALLAFLGQSTSKTLDIGCGEGRVARELRALGHEVTACDAVAEMVEAARAADSADDYAVAPITALPFADASFDRVVAYNVLMDVEDVPAAVRELARVLRPDGEFIISVVHPFADRGHFANEDWEAPFVVTDSYFGRQRFEGTEARNGVSMHFAGWSMPLEDYIRAITAAGLAITGLSEPLPSPDFPRLAQRNRIPLFLWMKARPFTR